MKRFLLLAMALMVVPILAACAPELEGDPLLTEEQALSIDDAAPPTEKTISNLTLSPVETDFFADRDDYYANTASLSTWAYGCMVILEDGTVLSWGEDVPQSPDFEMAPSMPYLSEIFSEAAAVSCGRWSSFAIDTEGTLWGWGIQMWGNITGTANDDIEPHRLMTDVQMASIELRSYLALRKDGTLWTWGTGEYGLLGGGSKFVSDNPRNPLAEPINVLDNVIFAGFSGAQACAIKDDFSLWKWGYMGVDNETNKSIIFDSPVCIMDDVKYAYGDFVVKTDGTLWVLNSSLLNKRNESESGQYYEIDPVQIMEGVKYASGGIRFIVIKENGGLWVWGDNRNGSLGTGTDEYIEEPLKIMDDVVYATTTTDNMYILKNNGELWETGIAYGVLNPSTGSENTFSFEEALKSSLPHKILEGVLVADSNT